MLLTSHMLHARVCGTCAGVFCGQWRDGDVDGGDRVYIELPSSQLALKLACWHAAAAVYVGLGCFLSKFGAA
jgi:hypothetical protein